MTLATDRATTNFAEAVSPEGESPAFNVAPVGCVSSHARIVPARYFRWKGLLGRLLASLLLVPAIPVIVLLVLAVRLTSRGPGIYRQSRVGRNGRIFHMYKIRTMRHDAEAVSGPEWAKKDDSRVTPLGRLLRKLHLDEFPQLFNVLKGEMSLIGPRPERPEFTQKLAREIPGYLDRLLVNPGITGLAQINLPPDTTLEDVRRKLVLDLEYIREASMLLDIRMFISTFLRMVCLPGDFAMKLMCLQRHVPYFPPTSLAQAEGPLTPSTIVAAQTAIAVPANGKSIAAIHLNGKPTPNGIHKHVSANAGPARELRVEVNGADC